MRNKVSCFIVVALAACSADRPGESEPSLARELGVARFEITRAVDALTIVGVSLEGEEVARIDLALGTFDIEDHGVVFGRRLVVDVRGKEIVHESAGVPELNLPIRSQPPEFQALLLDAQVAWELAARGIAFDASGLDVSAVQPRAESQYSCDTYNSGEDTWIGLNCTYSGCSNSSTYRCMPFEPLGELPEGQIGEFRCCNAQPNGVKAVAERRCNGTGSGNATGCGNTGTNGCTVCWTSTWGAGCHVDTMEGDSSVQLYYCD